MRRRGEIRVSRIMCLATCSTDVICHQYGPMSSDPVCGDKASCNVPTEQLLLKLKWNQSFKSKDMIRANS